MTERLETRSLLRSRPEHPVGRMLRIALRSPDAGEGSRGHLRPIEADEVLHDYVRAVTEDASVLDEYEDGYQDFIVIRAACTRHAIKSLIRWMGEDKR